jgi:hypothetical protein
LIVVPADGRIPPMTAEGQKRTAAIPASLYYDNSGAGVFNGPEDLSVYDRCITRGLIGSMVAVGYNAGNQIVQGPGWVALRNEMIHEARMIPTDGRKHVSPGIRILHGRFSRALGRRDARRRHHELQRQDWRRRERPRDLPQRRVHVVERFTRVDANTIRA